MHLPSAFLIAINFSFKSIIYSDIVKSTNINFALSLIRSFYYDPENQISIK